MKERFPRYFGDPGEWIRQVIEIRDREVAAEIRQSYSIDNITVTRSFDADATTVDELADFIGTYLRDKGEIR